MDLPVDADGNGLYSRFAIAPEFLGPALTWDKVAELGWQWNDLMDISWGGAGTRQ